MTLGPDESTSSVSTIFKLSWIIVIIAALVVAGIFYSRWQENRDIEEKAAAAKRAKAQQLVEDFGGNDFKILNFYAAPGAILRGDEAAICYGVSNAKFVTLEPKASEDVWPSLDRCVEASPKKTTTYTLTASDAAGHKKTATLTLTVQ
ncbi:MAG TPA: hypothetical protein VMV59_03715 [Candidatus Dormibacteraeota bacterium]|nr:hypothetical protein [Candidatus Dormibacteraeota bacterium]